MLSRILFLLLLALNIGVASWLYFAPPPRAQALARQLSERGVRDYYVVTAGDQPNTISLGLFHDQANADKRRDEVAKLGFAPQVVARTEQLPVYWIDFAEERDHPLDWRAHL